MVEKRETEFVITFLFSLQSNVFNKLAKIDDAQNH